MLFRSREIYARPATAYAAQFIGQTNLLRAEMRRGTAHCGALSFPMDGPDGPAILSLRPEAIRLAAGVSAASHVVCFRAVIRQQIYSGSSELLEVECADGQLLRVRIPSRGPLCGEHEFEFSSADAIRVRGA